MAGNSNGWMAGLMNDGLKRKLGEMCYAGWMEGISLERADLEISTSWIDDSIWMFVPINEEDFDVHAWMSCYII